MRNQTYAHLTEEDWQRLKQLAEALEYLAATLEREQKCIAEQQRRVAEGAKPQRKMPLKMHQLNLVELEPA
jgi:hypothetical protein